MGLSAALKEKMEFANGGVKTTNFGDYDLLRMSEAPEIDVHIVTGRDPLGGIGEPGVPPIAPAVANAVFAATGARLRSLPMTPEAVIGGAERIKNLATENTEKLQINTKKKKPNHLSQSSQSTQRDQE